MNMNPVTGLGKFVLSSSIGRVWRIPGFSRKEGLCRAEIGVVPTHEISPGVFRQPHSTIGARKSERVPNRDAFLTCSDPTP